MRTEVLLRYFGRFHLLVGGLFLVPMAVGLYWGDTLVWPYVGPFLGLEAVGIFLVWLRRRRGEQKSTGLRRREGFLLVALSWILMILYGSMPFIFSGSIDDLAAAIFESASAFTTTGATVFGSEDGYGKISAQPYGILFWRSFGHWLGGMGIIVLSLAILPELKVGGMQLFSAESSGLGVDKLAPRIAQTAKKLWVLYAALTVTQLLLFLAGDMDPFQAVNHAFATLATGGFSPLDNSIGQYAIDEHESALYFEVVTTVFMLIAGINFALQYRVIVRGDLGALFRSTEVRVYLGIIVIVSLLIAIDLYLSSHGDGLGQCLRDSSFQVVAILTTTGFGTQDFNLWPTFSTFLIVLMMAVGGCGGSTAGGLKVVRVVVLVRHALRECKRLLWPRMVRPVSVDGKAVDDAVIWGILGFFALYMIAWIAATILLATLAHAPVEPGGSTDIDIVTATTASLSALNSIGPGLGRVGASENFGFIHPLGKLALSFCMLLGRLEIYSLLILFLPSFWRGR